MRHAWGPREERHVPWSVLPVGQYRCTRPGCGVIKTTDLATDGYMSQRITVYLTPEGIDYYGKAPACQGGNDGSQRKGEEVKSAG